MRGYATLSTTLSSPRCLLNGAIIPANVAQSFLFLLACLCRLQAHQCMDPWENLINVMIVLPYCIFYHVLLTNLSLITELKKEFNSFCVSVHFKYQCWCFDSVLVFSHLKSWDLVTTHTPCSPRTMFNDWGEIISLWNRSMNEVELNCQKRYIISYILLY